MKRYAPATERNRDPILEVLRRVLPFEGLVLEIASGSGEHAVYLGARLQPLVWQPTDEEITARQSIDAWREEAGAANVKSALALDASSETWPVTRCDAVACINMIHIAPWTACVGLMRGASRVLPRGGVLYLYGPYRMGGDHTAPSNERFDKALRERDSSWGVRNLEDVIALADESRLGHEETVAMPANNLSVIFRKG